MASPIQVGNGFVIEFAERVAKNSADLADLYGHRASLTMSDFEHGVKEARDGEVRKVISEWANTLKGSQISVDAINSAPIADGVNVFLTLTATGALQQYYQIVTTLEYFSFGYSVEGYYVRHQVISRVGAVAAPPKKPAAEEPKKAKKVEAPAKPAPAPEQPKVETPAPKVEAPVVEPVAAPEPAAPAAPAAVEEPVKPAPAPAAPAAPSKPTSWAKLVSSAPVKAAENKPVRVVAHDGKEPAAKESPVKDAPAAAGAAKRERPPRREKRAETGDRLMFTAPASYTDDEVRAALGPVAESLVSLRNNSKNGHVFMDFAEGVNAFDDLQKMGVTIGAAKEKIVVYRQRSRD